MDAGLDKAGSDPTDVAERLRARDPEAIAAFLGSWSGAVDRYCRTVCEPGLVADAVEVTFADFLEKVDSHPIGDSHLESALMRSTRVTAAEAARIDWHEPGVAEDDESSRFDCKLTPLFLAGSPSVPASVDALARMDEHVRACPRCRATTHRFDTAETALLESKDAHVPEVLEALLERFSIPGGEARAEADADVVEPELRPEAAVEPEPEPELRREAAVEPEPEPDLGPEATVQPEPGLEPGALPGTAIGGFRIVAISGEDADGVVFGTAVGEQAQQVALRLAPADRDPDFTARFVRDARLLAGLEHPSLPSVLAVGDAPAGAYVVTEGIEGRSLASVVERGLPTKRAIRMLGEVADALDAAHAAGLLHRQLRPANVVVGAWLVVRPLLVNFALGRSREVVRTGEQTPYLTPEELRGETVGPAADRYAFACTLFELLTGKPPFGPSTDAAVHGHLDERAPLASDARPDLPPALDAVFERALSESPDERFASAAELTSEVSRAMSGPATSAPPWGAPRVQPSPTDIEPAAPEIADADGDAAVPAPQTEPDAEPEPEAEAEPEPEPDAEPEPEPSPELAEPVGESEVEAPHPPAGPDVSPTAAEGRRDRPRTRTTLIAAAGLAAVAVVSAVVALVGGNGSENERTSAPARAPAAPAGEPERRAPVKSGRPPGPPVVLAGTKATDYDPNGGNGENHDKVGALTDRDVKTAWQTEDYPRGTFGPGVGAYISLPRRRSVREIEIRTTTPGWDAEIYGTSAARPPGLSGPGWMKLSTRSRMRRVERIDLRKHSQPLRHCLVWITTLPPLGQVSIGEIRLFR